MKAKELRQLVVEQLRSNQNILWQDYTWGEGTPRQAVRTLEGGEQPWDEGRRYYMTLYDNDEIVLATRKNRDSGWVIVASSKQWCGVDLLWWQAAAQVSKDDAATRRATATATSHSEWRDYGLRTDLPAPAFAQDGEPDVVA